MNVNEIETRMKKQKKVSLGVEDFKEIIDKNGYFVDKTLMIKELLESNAKVTLFTRPRRFGKTLNQFMIRRFFEDEITEQGEKVDNGYCFGKTEIYNPWSVLNYIRMGENVFLTMAIPNTEIKTIYKDSISYWFDQRMKETDREHS